ncbi:MAG: Uma2 family endonuclease [Snowella sp.]|nr:Uma2 family endonuclease [Snowella sp.]
MTTLTKPKLTFANFMAQCPDEGRFEFINGEIVEMVNTRQHKIIAEFILFLLNDEIRRSQSNFIVTTQATIRTFNKKGSEQGRIPDVSVIDRTLWRSAPTDYAALTEPIQMAVEVISTNWENDYIDKLYEYEKLGIKEYWIVDYLAIASRALIGDPKFPTISVYTLNEENQYTLQQFRDEEKIISPTFAELQITPAQIFQA